MQAVYNGDCILVVEDDALLSSHICEVLVELGFVVAGCASTGAEAMALAELNPPALALVDIHISGPMDGIEVARLLRERFGVPSIFLSGSDDEQIIERARAAGPLGFLLKPFRPSQVFDALNRALISDRDEESRQLRA